jgi:SAM-dependent methyltransferase
MTELGPEYYDGIFKSGQFDGATESLPWYPLWVKGIEFLNAVNATAVIDIGCGPGHFAEMVSRELPEITSYLGVDFSEVAIDKSRRKISRQGFDFQVSDLRNSLPIDKAATYVAFEVLEHLEDDLALLDKIPAGCPLILSVPRYAAPSHVRWFPTAASALCRYIRMFDGRPDVWQCPGRKGKPRAWLLSGVKAKAPLVSIIVMAVRNRGYLPQALESAVTQITEYPYEVILASDGNPNLDRFAERYGVRFVLRKKPAGEKCGWGGNFNNALKVARGTFIKTLHDDDFLPPEAIQRLVDGIGTNDMVHANAVLLSEVDEARLVWSPEKKNPTSDDLLTKNHIHGGTTLYRKDALLRIGGCREDLWTGEELDLHIQLLGKTGTPAYVNAITTYNRRHATNKSKQNRNQRVDAIKAIRERYLSTPRTP